MEKAYKIERDTVTEALDDIDNFFLTLEKLKKDKGITYTYSLDIRPLTNPKRWEVDLRISKDERYTSFN